MGDDRLHRREIAPRLGGVELEIGRDQDSEGPEPDAHDGAIRTVDRGKLQFAGAGHAAARAEATGRDDTRTARVAPGP